MHTQSLAAVARVATYGVTERAARAVLAAGGRVVFESEPGRPAFFAPCQAVLYPPPGTVPIPRPGPFSQVGFVLPTGEKITADCQCRQYALRSGPDAELGPWSNFDREERTRQGVGDWGTGLTLSALARVVDPVGVNGGGGK